MKAASFSKEKEPLFFLFIIAFSDIHIQCGSIGISSCRNTLFSVE